MKNLFSILIISMIFFVSCEIPVEYNPNNDVPDVNIIQNSQTVDNGQSVFLTVNVSDQDHTYHYYAWTIDGNITSNEETFTFSESPDFETVYIVGLTVSDGEGIGSDSIIITVLEPTWRPLPLHIYFFEIGVEEIEENIIRDYGAISVSEYNTFLTATVSALEIYNRDNDPDCYRVFGGTN